ncbi:hypothetical protein EEL31_08720 [Brevibacillus laterosporus]|nr:hypothetical protein [Brevibacillus laterosporus]TPG68592.1 hypothetical protein EEL31_08720 [Brevibacillus laterosporus]
MEKVKLPKEVAEAVDRIWNNYSYDPVYVKHLVLTNWNFLREEHCTEYVILSSYAKDKMINYVNALMNGYEIDMTQKEELLHAYKHYKDLGRTATHFIKKDRCWSVCIGIEIAVDKLGYKIEGINA